MKFLLECFLFGTIFTIFGFIVSYLTDFFNNRKINWFPSHSYEMASGTFLTSVLVYIIFINVFLKLKCKSI